MRSLKAALVAFVGGVLLTAAVPAVEMVHAETSISSQIADCHTAVGSDRSDTVCGAATQVGGTELPVAFTLGFAFGDDAQNPRNSDRVRGSGVPQTYRRILSIQSAYVAEVSWTQVVSIDRHPFSIYGETK